MAPSHHGVPQGFPGRSHAEPQPLGTWLAPCSARLNGFASPLAGAFAAISASAPCRPRRETQSSMSRWPPPLITSDLALVRPSPSARRTLVVEVRIETQAPVVRSSPFWFVRPARGQAACFRLFLIQEGPSAIVSLRPHNSFPLTKEPGLPLRKLPAVGYHPLRQC